MSIIEPSRYFKMTLKTGERIKMISPMLCEETYPQDLFKFENRYVAERKYNGTRVLIDTRNGEFKIYNRHQKDYTKRLLELHETKNIGGFAMDGEAVVFRNGKDCFTSSQRRCSTQELRKITKLKRELPICFMAFDLLYLNDKSTENLPYIKRKELLQKLIEKSGWKYVKYVPHNQDLNQMWEKVINNDWEGIVLKEINSKYSEDDRNYDWLKVKLKHEDIVDIIGFTEGKGRRAGLFGALLVAKNGEYRGKVGSGFSHKDLEWLKLILKKYITPKINLDLDDNYTTTYPPIKLKVEYERISERGRFIKPVVKSFLRGNQGG